MRTIKCDECAKQINSAAPPPGWVSVTLVTPAITVEQDYCSRTCAAKQLTRGAQFDAR